VEHIVVQESPAAQRLEAVGLDRPALAASAQKLLEGAPGFVAPERARKDARRYLGELRVLRADALVGGVGGPAVAHVVVTLELTPRDGAGGGGSEVGRAAEPVGSGASALRTALERATRSALERATGAFALGLQAASKPTPELVKDLASPEARVREHAVRALADRSAREAVPALLDRLQDPDPDVAEKAVGALAQLRDPRAVPRLIELTRRREGPYVANLAHIVGDIGGADAQAWLLTIASGHPDEVVRGAAKEALAEMSARDRQAAVAGAAR